MGNPDSRRAARAAILLAVLVATGSCGRGCSSCSPLGRLDDPLALMPADSAVLLQVDVGALENDAIFRTLVMSLWDSKSCLATAVIDGVQSVTVTMRDAVPDQRTFPRVAIVTRDADPEKLIECLQAELFPGAGKPEQEQHRGVTLYGYPERTALRLGIVNDRMLVLGDRDGIKQMLDTVLDGKPSLATDDPFADLAVKLPEGAQVTVLALPGPALRQGARDRLDMPWSAVLDSTEVVAGLAFSKSGLRFEGTSRTARDPAQLARAIADLVEITRRNRLLRMLGIADLLSDVHVKSTGESLLVSGTAPEKKVTRVIEGAGSLLEIGL